MDINMEMKQMVNSIVVEIVSNAEKEYKKMSETKADLPVRKSVRKTKAKIKKEREQSILKALRSGVEEGLEARFMESKRRGIFSTKNFNRGDFVTEYAGDLITKNTAMFYEKLYAATDKSGSSYMFYFKHNEKTFCVDATEETCRLGRLANHSRNNNLITKTVTDEKRKPRLVLIAKHDIEAGSELTLDYGDRNKNVIAAHPWLAE